MSQKSKRKRAKRLLTYKDVDRIDLTVPLELAAADGGDVKLPTFKMLAYSGGVLDNPMGFGEPIVIDVSGVQMSGQIPIQRDHDSSQLVGHATPRKFKGTIEARGTISFTNDHAREVVESSKNGFPWQASIGLRRLKIRELDDGETEEINGRTVKGPLWVADSSQLREISFVSVGADDSTEVSIAAKADLQKEIGQMTTFAEWLAARKFKPDELEQEVLEALEEDFMSLEKAKALSASAVKKTPEAKDEEPETEEPESIAAAAVKPKTKTIEEKREFHELEMAQINFWDRQTWIQEHLQEHPRLAAEAAREKWSESEIRLAATRARRPKGPGIHVAPGIENVGNQAITVALLRACGVPAKKTHPITLQEWGIEHWYPQEVLEASDHKDLRHLSLHQLIDLPIKQLRGHGYQGNRSSEDFIAESRQCMNQLRASTGFTTLEVSNIFEDSAQKLLWAGYSSISTTWQEVFNAHSVSKVDVPGNVYRLTTTGGMAKTGNDGQLEHGGFAEAKYTATANERGIIVAVAQKFLINDDLNAFSSLLTSLGVVAAQAIEEIAYVHMLANKGTIWTAGQGNYFEGAATNLQLSSLTSAANLFYNQVSANLTPIGITPDRIIVDGTNRVIASQLFNDTEVREGVSSSATAAFFTNNPHAGAFRPIVTPYIGNTAIKQKSGSAPDAAITGQAATNWWMMSDPNGPQGATLIMALLNGNRTPTLQQDDASFEHLGLRWRAFHYFGASTGDPKLSVMSKGAS
jgi:hypothetical protein